MNKKFLMIGAAVILLAAGCNKTQPAASTEQQPFQDAVIGANGEIYQDVSYKGQTGKTALEILKAKYPVKTKTSSFGEFVESINNIMPDKNHFWSFYINGKLSNVGAGSYTTKDSDTITWKLEEIK
jgi:hypothetical protein